MPDVLIAADSIRSPEMRHEVPLAVPGPFLYVEREGERHVVVPAMEGARIEALGLGLVVHPNEEFGSDEIASRGVPSERIFSEVARRAVAALGVRDALAPPGFPLELADELRADGVRVRADRELFRARRRAKNEVELAGIRRAQAAAEAGMHAAAELLRAAEASGGSVLLEGEPLTCERLKRAIGAAVADRDASAPEMIVAHGAQSAEGHNLGSGAIAAGEPVVVDLWPRDHATGCYADMTRTFVVGEPDDELRRFHEVTRDALRRALEAVRPGASGRAVFEASCSAFHEAGYPTILSKRPGEVLRDGFFHSLGHGVGLDVHEAPYLSRTVDELVAGDVITLEPGCYRHGYGGCRLEDLVLVTAGGCENLTRYPYDLTP